MPTLPPSPVSSIHSWSFVYLKPAGYAIVAPHRARGPAPGSPEGLRYVTHLWQPRRAALLRPLIERHRHDARARTTAADVDVELGAGRDVPHREVGHADGFLQMRRLRPAGHGAGFGIADIRLVA